MKAVGTVNCSKMINLRGPGISKGDVKQCRKVQHVNDEAPITREVRLLGG
jgi:hypothetical protein